ncbi:MAG: ribonucleotide-diphosphate reductase subunit beta [Parvibaculaceae bacterium]|jgi:type II protein arginine methyltransferase
MKPETGVKAAASATRDFPTWHFAMLNDHDRNTALEQAIKQLDVDGKTIFEIGTGCGLIALLFAKHGARVFTCEMNHKMAAIARSVIAPSGLADRITLIAANSSEVVKAGLLPGTPDIIFTETLDCGVVGEGFFAIARDIRQVAGPETRVIPERIRQFGQLVDAPALTRLNRVGEAAGFDLSALNIYSTPTYFPVREKLYDYTPLSEPFLLREYIYTQDMPHRRVNIEPYRSGKADGILSWFEAEFVHETVTNSPGTHGHWHQAFHPFEIAADVTAKRPLVVRIADDGRISVL